MLGAGRRRRYLTMNIHTWEVLDEVAQGQDRTVSWVLEKLAMERFTGNGKSEHDSSGARTVRVSRSFRIRRQSAEKLREIAKVHGLPHFEVVNRVFERCVLCRQDGWHSILNCVDVRFLYWVVKRKSIRSWYEWETRGVGVRVSREVDEALRTVSSEHGCSMRFLFENVLQVHLFSKWEAGTRKKMDVLRDSPKRGPEARRNSTQSESKRVSRPSSPASKLSPTGTKAQRKLSETKSARMELGDRSSSRPQNGKHMNAGPSSSTQAKSTGKPSSRSTRRRYAVNDSDKF